MTPPSKRLTTFLVAAVLALAGAAGPATAHAQEGGSGDNAAIAVNTKDDSSLFRLAFSIKSVTGEVVDQTNAAVAYASCERCQTVAIAVQVVLVMTAGGPDVVTPTNLALAINEACNTCATLALAYQFVIGNGSPLRLTADGRRRIAGIRRRLLELRKEDLSNEEIRTATNALVEELRGVLATELVPREGPPESDEDEEETEPEEEDPGRREDEPGQPAPPPASEPQTTGTAPQEPPPPTAPQPQPQPEPPPPAESQPTTTGQ